MCCAGQAVNATSLALADMLSFEFAPLQAGELLISATLEVAGEH